MVKLNQGRTFCAVHTQIEILASWYVVEKIIYNVLQSKHGNYAIEYCNYSIAILFLEKKAVFKYF